ncbi:MAG: tetratricopeptide (TPR) repeat protein [Arenicella sp.]|jgi:tetratricopeptide (TPR) repeat protein
MGEHSKALELFDQAIQSELEMHNENWISQRIYFHKARTLHLLGEQEKAIDFYDKSIKVWDKSSESFYFKGLAQIELQDSITGYETLDSALSLIKKGYKTSDGYVELFDEIYQADIEKAIGK